MEGAALDRGREFFRQIKENPRDLELRAVYADWLEEYGDGDLDMRTAAEQRSWTLEKQDAKERMEKLSAAVGHSYPAVMECFRLFLVLGTPITVPVNGFKLHLLGLATSLLDDWDFDIWWQSKMAVAWMDYALLTGADTSKVWWLSGKGQQHGLKPRAESSPIRFQGIP